MTYHPTGSGVSWQREKLGDRFDGSRECPSNTGYVQYCRLCVARLSDRLSVKKKKKSISPTISITEKVEIRRYCAKITGCRDRQTSGPYLPREPDPVTCAREEEKSLFSHRLGNRN